MSAAPNPAASMGGGGGAAGGPGAGGPGGGGQQGNPQVAQVMEEFRPLAESIKALGQKYPEGQEEAVQILKQVQGWMAKVAGNPQRTPEAKAPPV